MRSTMHRPLASEARKFYGAVMARAPAAAIAAYEAAMGRGVPVPRAAEHQPARFKGRDGKSLARPAVQGVACLFDTVVTIKGEKVLFWRECFNDTINDRDIRLLLDHDSRNEVGATACGLEFAVTGPDDHINGLVFRMPLEEDSPDSQLIVDTVSQVERPCMSVGIRTNESYTKEIDGQQVRIITRATLTEVSLVPEGAVPGTAITLVDLADEPLMLLAAARSTSFAVDKLISNADGKMKRLEREVHKVAARTKDISEKLLEVVSQRQKAKQ